MSKSGHVSVRVKNKFISLGTSPSDYKPTGHYADQGGNCELCGTRIRYQFEIKHIKNGSSLKVGSDCVENYVYAFLGEEEKKSFSDFVGGKLKEAKNKAKEESFRKNHPGVIEQFLSDTETLFGADFNKRLRYSLSNPIRKRCQKYVAYVKENGFLTDTQLKYYLDHKDFIAKAIHLEKEWEAKKLKEKLENENSLKKPAA